MTDTDIAIVITAIATTIYTIGTFMLWFSTRRTAALAESQARQTEKTLRGQIYTDLVAAHRDFFTFILTNTELSKILESDLGIEREELLKAFIGTLVINHVSQIYHHNQYGNIDANMWPGLIEDMRDTFTWPLVQKRWSAVREYHPVDFRKFIDGLSKVS